MSTSFKVTVTVESGAAAAEVAGSAAAEAHAEQRHCVICKAFLSYYNAYPTCGFCFQASCAAWEKQQASRVLDKDEKPNDVDKKPVEPEPVDAENKEPEPVDEKPNDVDTKAVR